MRTLLLAVLAATWIRAEDTGAKVYQQVTPSCTWIHARQAQGLATGSGTLIDADRRLVLTNYHVVGEQDTVQLYFPAYRDGQPVAEKEYYLQRVKSLGLVGKVVARDRTTDLALIQLGRLPEGKKGVPLAAAGARPGQSVHSIGNTGKSGALWGYVPGKVRQVYQKEWRADLGGGATAVFKAKVVETDSATNPGDSGGPLVNDAGELVGVTQGGAVGAQLVSTFIDISEVKRLLAAYDEGTSNRVQRLKRLRRVRPATISDQAGLFQQTTIQQAQEIVDALHAKGFDILVETHREAPAADQQRLQAMSREERMAYMRDWVDRRMTAENVHDLGILISQNPRSYFVRLSEDAQRRFPPDFHRQMVETLGEGLKANQPDEALLKILTSTRSQYESR